MTEERDTIVWRPRTEAELRELGVDIPSAPAVQDARQWLLAGAPAAHRDFKQPEVQVKVLLRLMDLLPYLLPRYCYGTEESRASYKDPA